MNRYMQDGKWSWIEGTHGMRMQLLETLSDADLAFSPGGVSMKLGALLREMGEVEYSYIQSLRTLQQDWSYHNTEAGLEDSIPQLKMWYQRLDDEMKATVAALSDDDLAKVIDRGGGFSMSVEVQLDVYLQALLIFFGKVSIYLKAMDRALPESVQQCIW
ncbi:MAG TPA: DinB family protein [Ktedonobacteraceae bacterium]|nr:DinB family protein [Ktedonobacteraceae bacterium]